MSSPENASAATMDPIAPPERPPRAAQGGAAKLIEPFKEFASEMGNLVGFSVYAIYRMIVVCLTFRLSLSEVHDQSRFISRVCSVPALLLTIPVGALIAISVGNLAGKLGAEGYSGAATGMVIVGQAAALVCALMLAGVAGSAITADLGARKIREEIDAMEVMGVDPVDRLVVPRLIATMLVAVAMCSLVAFAGVIATMLYQVYYLKGNGGEFLATFSAYSRSSDLIASLVKALFFGLASALVCTFKGLIAKEGASGVADAVNEAVVIAFVVAFVVNTVLSQLYSVLVPAVGNYV